MNPPTCEVNGSGSSPIKVGTFPPILNFAAHVILTYIREMREVKLA
jgi:hypothetical protein